jgi:hypothetical protein
MVVIVAILSPVPAAMVMYLVANSGLETNRAMEKNRLRTR